MKTMLMHRAAALVLTAGIAVGTAGTAVAQTEADPTGGGRRGVATEERIDVVKARCEAAIDRRLPALAALKRALAGASWVTDGHRSELNGQIDAEVSGLTALKAKIHADTDRTTLIADCRSIVHDYRVFLLMIPKTRLVIAADRIPSAAAKLTDVAGRLQGRIDAAKAAGKDVTAAQAALDHMKAQIRAATDAASGVAGKVLPLKPQDYPDNRPVLLEARQALGTAREDLRTAAGDGRRVVAILKSLA